MTGGQALASRAIGDVARRALASEWGGPEPAAARPVITAPTATRRRAIVRKP